jgi:hypothetical protein
MSKWRHVSLSVLAAGLLCWLVVDVKDATGGIIDPCGSLVWTTGTMPACMMNCPVGDGRSLDTDLGVVIYFVVKDGAGSPVQGILPQDVWLVGCSGTIPTLQQCAGAGSVDADSATNASGQSTISGRWAASGCDPTGVSVVVEGIIIADEATCIPICLDIAATSPDLSGDGGIIDGIVELADFSQFGLVYNKPAQYDACWDFNCDTLVDLLDFSLFGLHWMHDCQGP